MKKLLTLVIILLLATAVGWFGYNKYIADKPTTNNDPLVTYSPFETPEQKEIEVFLPAPGTTSIGTKFVIYGKGRAFENTINYRISDDTGKQLSVGSFMTNAPDAGIFGYFREEVDLTKILKTIPPAIRLDVLELSARDGSDTNKTSFELSVDQSKTAVFVSFANDKLDPEITCEKTYSVARIITKTPTILKAAIEELMLGPTTEELNADFRTAINSGVKLNSAKIEDGTAYLDFDNRLEELVGGSCRVQLIRQQIETTAKQFPTIKDVIISINGQSEPILQP